MERKKKIVSSNILANIMTGRSMEREEGVFASIPPLERDFCAAAAVEESRVINVLSDSISEFFGYNAA